MKKTRVPAGLSALVFGCSLACCLLARGQEQKIDPTDRERAEIMLADMKDAVKKHYYDPTLRGIDVDARYRTYKERLEKAETLGDSYRIVAAFMAGFDDSHTFFIPPRRSYRLDYGYQMQMIGDGCYITEVRPETDAAQKLQIGDQVLSLDGFAVNHKDLWQLEYYLNELAPKPATEFTVRSPNGTVKKVQVQTKYVQGKRLKDLTLEHGEDNDLYNVIFERDKEVHLLRSRYVEDGDVMFWKMPAFVLSEEEVDHLMNIARKHKTLILDLRDDPGGSIVTLNRMIGDVFDHDVQVGIRVQRKGQKPLMISIL